MADFHIKRGDRLPVFEATLLDGDGKPINLATASSVTLRLRERGSASNLSLVGTCVVTNSSRGEVEYRWASGETDTVGTFQGELVVAWSDGRTQTVPSRGTLQVVVSESLAAS